MLEGSSMKTFYFTGTGNCLQVARGLDGNGELISIPLFLRQHAGGAGQAGSAGQVGDPGQTGGAGRVLIQADTIGLVFPTYWLVLPTIVVEFLERVSFDTEYLFAITTCGNVPLTLKSHLLQVASQNNHSFSYFDSISMPDNFLPFCDMAKQKKRFSEAQLQERSTTISRNIRSRQRNVKSFAALAPLRPLIRYYSLSQMTDFTRRFTIDTNCNKCGTCCRVCSAQSIAWIDDSPTYSTTCNYCLACVHNCPQNAIHMNGEKSSERYLNPTVTTSDLISSAAS
jgi:Pyruvate/2-oxoacid:ferredoxin oxidoreductase delta subunit